jgi:hypothetical protein
MAPRSTRRQFHHVYCHDTHCVPVARPLRVSIVIKIQVVRAYSSGSKEQRIEHDGPKNEQRRRHQPHDVAKLAISLPGYADAGYAMSVLHGM